MQEGGSGEAEGRRVDGFVGCLWLPSGLLWLPATSVVTRVTLGSRCHAPNPCITLMIVVGTLDKRFFSVFLLHMRNPVQLKCETWQGKLFLCSID